jgi:two-component system, LytTR family, response regulator
MPETPLATLIVDDELPARELLRAYAGRRAELRVVGDAADGTSAVEAIRRLSPDLLLLDVEMPSLDGFAVLEEIGRDGLPMPRVIYVTAFDRYAVRAFEVNAIDYLLKPVSEVRFNHAIDRCLAARPAPAIAEAGIRRLLEDVLHLPPQRVLVRDRGRIVPIPVAAIDWLEAERDYIRIHIGGRTHLIEQTFTRMETLLAPRGFARIHRSAMVNLDRIREFQPDGSGRLRLVLRDGTELMVSRSYAPRFREGVL